MGYVVEHEHFSYIGLGGITFGGQQMAFGRQSVQWTQLNQLDWVGWGHASTLEQFDSGWHAHDMHQLLYANTGLLHVVLEGETWVLPPGRCAWIRGHISHRVTTSFATLRTVYLNPAVRGVDADLRVFSVDDLAQQMFIYAQRWSHEAMMEPLALNYFTTLVGLFEQGWSQNAWSFSLPRSRDPFVQKAMAYAQSHLEHASLDGAARAALTSTRTLSRRFSQTVGMTWRAYLHQARLIYAMQLLSEGHAVTEVSFMIGFESPSAFAKAFKLFTGQLPSQFASVF